MRRTRSSPPTTGTSLEGSLHTQPLEGQGIDDVSSRNDANPATHGFVTSPDIVTALAISGTLDFDPRKDSLTAKDGSKFKLSAPVGEQLPSRGYDPGEDTFQVGERCLFSLISPYYRHPLARETSSLMSSLSGFNSWLHSRGGMERTSRRLLSSSRYSFVPIQFSLRHDRDYPIPLQVKGKCTTDHISAAGPWLKYRGHLDNISNNLLLTAVNAENGEMNKVGGLT